MTNVKLSLAGVFPPIPTPFDAEGDINHGALTNNIVRWNAFDLAGYVVLGSNGEVAYLTQDEKLRVLEIARSAMPENKLLIAGTGCESTRQTIELTQGAARIGADAALVLTPHYYGGKMTPDALVEHYITVADASPIPIILYNVPKFTHLDMNAVTIARAAQHPNIIGIKDSGGNIAKIGDIVRRVPNDFQVLAGSASFFFAALTLGTVGGVLALANVAPQQCLDIYRLYQTQRWDKAADLQRRMLPANTAITAQFGIAGLKAALDMLGYMGGAVRSPLRLLTEDEAKTLRHILVKVGVLTKNNPV